MTVYTIAQLTRQIKQVLEDEVGSVWVEGELSNYKVYGSGHAYFVLKDDEAQLSGVLFAGARRGVAQGTVLADGQRVKVYGEITVFPGRGQYQIVARKMEPSGEGDLMRRFEELKRRLAAEGLFDTARKRTLPPLPQRIAVVTSPTGAVIHDMLNVLGRRYPNVQVRLVPVKVQGAGAAEEIAAAVARVNAHFGAESAWPADLMIVGRGGGSIEDLWAFNEECVARAVAASALPVVSAVGHETDFTLCDFAADVRAPTPSAAAELVVPLKTELAAAVERQAQRLRLAAERRVEQARMRLAAAQGAGVFRRPQQITERLAQRVDLLERRLAHAGQTRLAAERERTARLKGRLLLARERGLGQAMTRLAVGRQRLEQAGRLAVERARQRLAAAERQLTLLSPLAVLERGYSLTSKEGGGLVRSAAEVAAGEVVVTRVADGEFRSVAQVVKE